MNVDPAQVKALFLQALEHHSPDERAAFLDAACAGNAELRRQVQILLDSHEQAGSFLENGAIAADAAIDEPMIEPPGSVIGPYKLLEPIGEGGMGVVYMAEQTEPVERRVALKIIKPGMDSRQVIARFEAERQALAMMDHPNIARVLDAGTTDSDRPYFVMELVKGIPITQYCDQHRLTARQRLDLFIPVCQAIQHAHQKGVIHRDLKPSNVLVAMYDDRPVPKVIDFGVAKATTHRLTDKTMFTRFGQVVGTFEYMSPEQAQLNQIDIDTRSDIYSLGVLLYELLTGTTPLDKQRLRLAALDEVLRIVREEEPPKPSTRLSTSETLPHIAANRLTEPNKLSALVRGDLDWIVMKALDKDRSRRYESAGELAADVQRFLHDEAVLACPPTAAYRFRKFAHRNKLAITAGLLVAASLIIGAGVASWQAIRAERALHAERLAQQRIDAARDIEDRRRTQLNRKLSAALVEASRLREQSRSATEGEFDTLVAARETAQRAAALAESELADPALVQSVQTLLDELELEERDRRLIDRLEAARLEPTNVDTVTWTFNLDTSASKYLKAFEDYGLVLGVTGSRDAATMIRGKPPAVQAAIIAALDHWIALLRDKNRPTDTDKQYLSWLEVMVSTADTDPWRSGLRDAAAQRDLEAMLALAVDPQVTQQPAYSLEFLGRTLCQRRRYDAGIALLRRAQTRYPNDFWINEALAYWLHKQRSPDYQESIRFASVMVALRPNYARAYYSLSYVLRKAERFEDAIAVSHKALEIRPDFGLTYFGLGQIYHHMGDLDAAIEAYRQVIRIDPTTVVAYENLVELLEQKGDLDAGFKAHRQLIRLMPKSAKAHRAFGDFLYRNGKYDAAIEAFHQAIRLDPKSAFTHTLLGRTFFNKGEPEKAIEAYREAIRLNPKYSSPHNYLGNVYSQKGDIDAAIREYRKALQISPELARRHNNLGRVLMQKGDLNAAIDAHRNAIRIDPKFAQAYDDLGLALAKRGDLDAAIESHEIALRLEPQSPHIHINLGNALRRQGNPERAIQVYERGVELQPTDTRSYHAMAWFFATCPLKQFANPTRAVEYAQKAVELAPNAGDYWNTLGAAHYRAGDYAAAIEALQQSRRLLRDEVGGGFSTLLLAMAHWQLDDKSRAREFFRQALQWMQDNNNQTPQLLSFRAEAEALMGFNQSADVPTTTQTPPDITGSNP